MLDVDDIEKLEKALRDLENFGLEEIVRLLIKSTLELNTNLEAHEHNINVIGEVVANKVPNSGLKGTPPTKDKPIIIV